MGFIILLIMSVVSMIVFAPLAKKTRIPVVLFFVVFGMFFSRYGVYDLFTQIDGINQNVSELSTLASYAIIILFLVTGLMLDMKNIKASGKSTLVLSILPAHVEGIILGVVAWAFFTFAPLDTFSFSIWAFMLVMLIFAMSTAAVVIPITIEAQAEGKKSKIFDQMSVASVLDNFTVMPLGLIFLLLAITVGVGKESGSVLGTIGIIIAVVLALVIFYVLGHFLGYLIGLIQNKVKISPVLMSLILIIVPLILVIVIGPVGATFGPLISLGVGIAFNLKGGPSPIKKQITQISTKIYGLALMPLIFIYMGSEVQIDLLLNPMLVIIILIIIGLAIAVKSIVSKKYLKSQGYTDEEASLSGVLFASRGKVLINFAIILNYTLMSAGLEDVLQYMYILATVAIIVSVPYCIIKSKKIIEKM